MTSQAMKRPTCIWRFDSNHRVYRQPEEGDVYGRGGPIWREHWVKFNVVGETSRSWLIGYSVERAQKVPKVGWDKGVFAFSEDEIDKAAWVYENAHRISHAVGIVKDYAILQQIAALVGYKERPLEAD